MRASSNQSTRILLVEGVPGIGKTSLVNSLIRRYINSQQRIRSLLHLTQAHTYFPLSPDEPERDLTRDQNLAHLERIFELLSWMVASVSYERRKIFLCTIDTLHITHCLRPGILSWDDVANFDMRMAHLGCKLLFLRATAETIWERTIWDRRDNEFITYYSKKYGDSLESIHKYYVREQEKMLYIIEQSAMETVLMDCDGALSGTAQAAYDYWMS